MFPLIVFFSSTPGANSNRQGADFNSNDDGGAKGIFHHFSPLFLTNKMKAWHLCMTANLQTSFFPQFFWKPPCSPFTPLEGASQCTALIFFCIKPLSSLEQYKTKDLVWGERSLLNRKEVPIILFYLLILPTQMCSELSYACDLASSDELHF